MADETMRTHVVFPKELVDAVDRLVGRRKRSAFVAQAVAEKLDRERLGNTLTTTAGFLADDAHPEWKTPEKVSAWVRELRSPDFDSSDRQPGRRGAMDPGNRVNALTLDDLLARLAEHELVRGVLLMGTTGTTALTPTSDYDLLLVFDALPVPLRMVTTRVEGRLAEVYCTIAEAVARVATNPAVWPDASEEGVLVHWLRDGRVVHDRDGWLATTQAQVRREPPPMMPDDREVYEARRKIAYNMAQLERYFAADDPVSHVVVDLRLLYSVFEVAFHYFTIRRLPWRGEKQAIRHWGDNDPEYLDNLRRCLAENDRQRKVGLYEELARRTLAPVGGLWESGVSGIATGAGWGARTEGVPHGTVDDALAFWQRLMAGDGK